MNSKITIKGICKTIKDMPQTILLIFSLDRGMTIKIILLGIITGILPLVSLLLSQELINGLVRENSSIKCILIVFISYILVSMISEVFNQLLSWLKNKFQYTLQYKLNYV